MTDLDRAIADMLAYDGPGGRYAAAEAEEFRKAAEAGLCVPAYDDDKGLWTFDLTPAGIAIIMAGGSVAGRAMKGVRLQ